MQRRIAKRTAKPTTSKPKLLLAGTPFEDEERRLQLQTDVMRLKTEGFSHGEIAKSLGITASKVTDLLTSSLDEYFADKKDEVRRFLAVANARYDRILRTWMPRAEGRYRKVKNEDGTEVEVFDPPEPEAARVVLTAMRDQARMLGLNKIRVEHTGKDGGAINVDVDWGNLSDEQLARFAETGDVNILHAFAGALASASAARDPSPSGTEG
jgi:hypothetical protein